jgi:hypothetical protein
MKQYLFILLLSLFSLQLAAQSDKDKNKENGKEKEEEKWTDDLFFGGSIWAQFGSVTQIEVAPVIGYHISPRFDAGLGARYIYYKTNFQRTFGPSSTELPNYSSHIYGGNVFTRYVLIKDLNDLLPLNIHGRFVTHIEYEGLSMPTDMDFTEDRSGRRFWSHNYLVGGGLQQKIGEKAYLNLLILYNLNEKAYSLYENPIIRIGVNF